MPGYKSSSRDSVASPDIHRERPDKNINLYHKTLQIMITIRVFHYIMATLWTDLAIGGSVVYLWLGKIAIDLYFLRNKITRKPDRS